MYLEVLLIAALFVFASAAFVAIRRPLDDTPRVQDGGIGKTLQWRLGENSCTEVLSNLALGRKQQLQECGGILSCGDVIVVWAEEFLDHDILYESVKDNILQGVKYVYILDIRHGESFGELDRKLRTDIPEEKHDLLRKGIDVLFVRNGLTLNNFVCMAAETPREQMYSAIIHDRRPVGWIRQSTYRAGVFTQRVKHLLAAAAIAQHNTADWRAEKGNAPAYSERIFELGDQEMDFSSIVANANLTTARRPSDLNFEIHRIITTTDLEDSAGKGAEVRGRAHQTLEPDRVVDISKVREGKAR